MSNSRIYANGPMEPVAQIDENVGVWTDNSWKYFKVAYLEGMPASSPMVHDFGAVAAGGTVAKAIVTELALDANQLLQLRFEPIDDVELILWLQQGLGKFAAKAAQARVTRFTRKYDPWLASTTFFVLGTLRDPYVEVRNPSPAAGYALAQSRVMFWGFRYVLEELKTRPEKVTLIPADGRGA